MTTDAAATFDAAAYRTTTRAQWEDAADAWHRWGPLIESWVGPATEVMLDLAAVGEGAKVLDVAAGAGGQTLAAARRVGPTGSVLATDTSPAILEYAAAEARRAGFPFVATREMDGEHLDVEPGFFDAAISRLGLIYFPDRHAALTGIRAALRPGGRFGALQFTTPEANRFFSAPIAVVRRRAQLPPPAPGQPGPFSLGSAPVVTDALTRAGFEAVDVHVVDAPVRCASAAECLRFERESFGALHQMLAGLDDDAKEAAWAEIGDVLTEFEGPDGFVGPCELIVVAATNPGRASS
jgi:SAM-dependent methyltransferase